jgi:NTP pyrophosphatase (non-canonical NTP hydrolase)
MDLRTYQARARQTDRNPGSDEESRMIPLAGLASETGELLGEYKKYLRDGAFHKLFRDRLAEEIGDLLWYIATVATKFDLDLEDIAVGNLAKCESRWGPLQLRKPFDEGFPDGERLPRRLSVGFVTTRDATGLEIVRVTCNGKKFGDPLNDNSRSKDGYGYHDVLHLSFAALLGWSPLVRRMLGAKRKSKPDTDRIEDGGRAIATEEGLAAMIFAYARDYSFFEGKSSVSTELLRLIRNMVEHLEVSVCSSGEWERAIIQGFTVWRHLRNNSGGNVEVDLDARSIAIRPE